MSWTGINVLVFVVPVHVRAVPVYKPIKYKVQVFFELWTYCSFCKSGIQNFKKLTTARFTISNWCQFEVEPGNLKLVMTIIYLLLTGTDYYLLITYYWLVWYHYRCWYNSNTPTPKLSCDVRREQMSFWCRRLMSGTKKSKILSGEQQESMLGIRTKSLLLCWMYNSNVVDYS